MNFFDNIWRHCFTFGMMASHAFAAMLYVGIFLLVLYTLGQTVWFLLT